MSDIDKSPRRLFAEMAARARGEDPAKVEVFEPTPEQIVRAAPDLGIDNPYWDAVKHGVYLSDLPWGGFEVGGLGARGTRSLEDRAKDSASWWERRRELTARYAWTITDPWSVQFVSQYVGARVLDPMAGTGYWAWLLGQLGHDVLCSDLLPPSRGSNENIFHLDVDTHVPVQQMDAVKAVIEHGHDRALLLAWPPYDDPAATHVLQNYPGDRLVFIGELGGCTGDETLIAEIAAGWEELACETPVQFFGLHDQITAFQRKDADTTITAGPP